MLDYEFQTRYILPDLVYFWGFTSNKGVMIATRFYTLVETCKLNGVSPRDYFVKVLEALTNDYGDYEKLTPDFRMV